MTEFNPNESMLQNYIQNKLNPQDTEQLELWLADHPEIMESLELDIMFSQSKEGFKQTQQPKQTQAFSIWNFFTSKKLVPINVLAYGLALIFVFNGLLKNNTDENFSAATFIELEKQRGADENIHVVNHNKKLGMTIRFFPDSIDDTYKIILKRQGSQQQFVINQLKSDENESITVMLDSNTNLSDIWNVEIYNGSERLEQKYVINLK